MQFGQVTTQGGDQCEAGSKEKRTDLVGKWGVRLEKSFVQQQVSGAPARAGRKPTDTVEHVVFEAESDQNIWSHGTACSHDPQNHVPPWVVLGDGH